MSAHYPLPIADKQFVDQLIEVYQRDYEVTLSFDEAKQLLEQMMQFIYLTRIDPIVNEVVGHYNDPAVAQQVMKELTRTGQWHKLFEWEDTNVEAGEQREELATADTLPPACGEVSVPEDVSS